MMRPVTMIGLLAIPLMGLAILWGWTHHRAQQGTQWDVPIGGYDPRDLLRGHYIRYTYRWPGLDGDDRARARWADSLCLEGTAPHIDAVTMAGSGPGSGNPKASQDCPHFVRAPSNAHEDIRGLDSGILYVSQTEAARLQTELGTQGKLAILRMRVREDGHITPLSIRFETAPDAALPAP